MDEIGYRLGHSWRSKGKYRVFIQVLRNRKYISAFAFAFQLFVSLSGSLKQSRKICNNVITIYFAYHRKCLRQTHNCK